MIALALRGIAERKLRSALTAIAVLLGVAMIAGTYVQTDQIRTAFEDIEQTANQGTDALIMPRTEFTSSFAAAEPISQAVLQRVAKVPGVARAEGSLYDSGQIVVGGKAVESSFAPSIVTSVPGEPFNPFNVVRGRLPAGHAEVAINRKLADDEGLAPGDRIGLTTRSGIKAVRLVGVVDYGDVASLGGATIVVATLPDMQAWYDRRGQVSQIAVAADEGTTPEQLAARLDAALPPTLEVKTGQKAAQDSADEINDAIGGFLTPALLALAGASLLVGAFIIFNTFSITVAQRTRELGMLRAIGATRRQVLGTIGAEALLIGATASIAGLLAGLGISKLLGGLFDAAGMGIPRGDMELAPRTIVIGLAVGIGVTLLSALAPALRATRVSPVAAMVEAPPPTGTSRRRTVVSVLVLALGLAGLLQGLFGGGNATTRLAAMGAGTLLVFVGVALTSRYLVRPLAAAIGWPLERLSPTTGQLARENAASNPARTATTAGALMVGLGLVVFVAVFANGLKSSFTGSIEDRFKADLIVTTDQGTPISREAEGRARATLGVRATTAQYADQIQVDGKGADQINDVLNGTDPRTLPLMYHFQWVDGNDQIVSWIGPGTAVVEEQFALTHGLERGDVFNVKAATGRELRLRVLGIYRDPQLLTGAIVDYKTFTALSSVTDPIGFYVKFDPGVDKAKVQASVEAAMRAFPSAKVRDKQQYQDFIGDQFDRIVYLLYALLAMSVVISLFGIANSLYLAVHERTRELGVLRAIGATAEQVRRLVRYESVITSVIGGILGIVVGLVFAYLTTLALDDLGLGFSVPVLQLVVLLVLAIVVGVVGAVAPARRASKVDVVEAVGAGQ